MKHIISRTKKVSLIFSLITLLCDAKLLLSDNRDQTNMQAEQPADSVASNKDLNYIGMYPGEKLVYILADGKLSLSNQDQASLVSGQPLEYAFSDKELNYIEMHTGEKLAYIPDEVLPALTSALENNPNKLMDQSFSHVSENIKNGLRLVNYSDMKRVINQLKESSLINYKKQLKTGDALIGVISDTQVVRSNCCKAKPKCCKVACCPRGQIGCTGATGARGPIGITGATGPAGAAGSPGTPGAPGVPGPVGPMGPIGFAGAAGAVGAVGATGATGATGVAGTGGVLAYGYVYNLTAQTIPIEAAVPFDSNGLLLGVAHTPSSPSIVVLSTGVYVITFSATVGGQTSQFTIFVNGVAAPSTVYGSGDQNQQNTGQAILVLTAGDIITLVNHSSAASVSLPSQVGGTQANVNASVLIERIA